MAHFAKLDENNIVLAVHVVSNEVITIDGVESEQAGIDFLTDLHGHTKWKQCSYNNTFRNRYPGIGWSFNEELNAFISQQPFPSWTFNNTSLIWEAPTSRPEDEKAYVWNEATQSWDEIAG
jgi:hypothetical protein